MYLSMNGMGPSYCKSKSRVRIIIVSSYISLFFVAICWSVFGRIEIIMSKDGLMCSVNFAAISKEIVANWTRLGAQ